MESYQGEHPVYLIKHLPSSEERIFKREKIRWVPEVVD